MSSFHIHHHCVYITGLTIRGKGERVPGGSIALEFLWCLALTVDLVHSYNRREKGGYSVVECYDGHRDTI